VKNENDSWQTMPKFLDFSIEIIWETKSEKQIPSFSYRKELKP